MESSKSNPLQEESFASIRRRNTLLIAILFSFIVSLSLIVGGSIIYLVLSHESRWPTPNPAVDGFCSAAESWHRCIATFSSSSKINSILFTGPIHVYTHSLESAAERLSSVGSTHSDNCSTSLPAAAARIEKALAIMRVDPENETRLFEERRGMVELILDAMEELKSCGEARVRGVEVLLRYSRDYLLKCDLVSRRFLSLALVHDVVSRSSILGVVADSGAVFGLQYFVLVFLFVLILLRCNLCYIGGCCRRV